MSEEVQTIKIDDIQVVSEAALSLITKAEIDIQISTAKAFPRSIKNFLDKAMSIATVNESVAESCSYALPRGGKTIEGASVRLAEIACAAYGNIRSGARVIDNDGKTITAQGFCHDLETNNSVTVEVKRSIQQNEYQNGQRTGRMVSMNSDMQVVTGNAACAIAFRNAVFKVIPSALIQEVYDRAKDVAKGTEETLPKRRDKAVKYFTDLRVTEKQLCDVLQVKRIEDVDLEKLSILRGMVTAVKNNETTIAELFSPKEQEEDKRQAAKEAAAKAREKVNAVQTQIQA